MKLGATRIFGSSAMFALCSFRRGVMALALACLGLLPALVNAANYTVTWTPVSTTGSPGAPLWRAWSAMTWAGSLNKIVMWGGAGAVFMNDIVAFDPVTSSWSTIYPQTTCPGNAMFAPPNGSDENGVVFDPISNLLWLYNGGSGYRCPDPSIVGRIAGAGSTTIKIVDPTLPATTDNFYKDWLVRVAGGAMARVTSYTASTKTLNLDAAIAIGPTAAYDLFVDFGGGTWYYSFSSGTYAKLDLPHWGYPGYLPPFRRNAGFASDGLKAILFSGADYDNGTFKLDFVTKSYSVLIPPGSSSAPAARGQIQNQFVYDSLHGRFILFGGRCFDPARCSYQSMLDDTWVYNPASNTWTQIFPPSRPPARNQGHMYFDTANGVVVLYAGVGNGGTLLNDLWTFDLASGAWTQQPMPPGSPAGIYLGQVAYAPTVQCGYVVYGLSGGTTSGTTWKLCLRPVGAGTPPIASFTTVPSTAPVGVPIAMSAAGSSDPDGVITGYAWNFGDGTSGSGVSVSKSYAVAGIYTVTLTVTDNSGRTATATKSVIVTAPNQPPIANFSAVPSPATVSAAIAFSAAASADPDGTIVNYLWTFGDGTTGSGVSISKTYSAAGVYTAALTVTDNAGATASTTRLVTITAGGSNTVWVEDDWPVGVTVWGQEDFTWVTANPTPYSGTRAHQSALASGTHQHYFTNAAATLALGTGDKLFAYVYLDPANPPKEVMLQFFDGSWEHRAYWGANLIPWGPAWDDNGRRYVGPLPPVGQWVRLEVPAAQLGLEGRTLTGMAFTLYDGRATWDRAGKSSSANQPPVASFTTTPSATTVGSPVALSAAASSDPDGTISAYSWTFGDGTTGSGVSISKTYSAAGVYTAALTVTDNAGATASTTRQITVTAGGGATTVWVEDDWPVGVTVWGQEDFTWVTANPTPYSGTRAHQSALASGTHQHYFTNAAATLALGTGDKLFAYVYLDPANPPKEVMLQFFDGSWEHRAYWGANLIPWGPAWDDNGRRYVGPLPPVGQWVRLEVPAAQLGLEGRTLTGMAFTLYDGRATWDRAGKSSSATEWVEDDWPTGAVVSGTEDFKWIIANPIPNSGIRAHQSALTSGIHQHYFTNAATKLVVAADDSLFADVYLDPANPPKEVMLQFFDGSWEHRAYWGANLIPWGPAWDDNGRRYVGPLPPVGQWVRLEVPAAQLGLEGRTLTGMAFTLYDGRATWDRAGKSSGN